MTDRIFWPAFIILIGALLAASVARAQDSVDWAGTTCRIDPTPPHDASIARVTCINSFINAQTPETPGRLALDGFPVLVVPEMGLGDVPDTFTLQLPEGFVAVPPSITLQEGETGVILIFAIEGALMG